MPPDHGAAVVRTILGDPGLSEIWKQELEGARLRIAAMRALLSEGLAGRSNALGAIAGQQGMFSRLPLDEREIMALRARYSIYMPLSGRINIAGLNLHQVPRLIEALNG